MKLYYTPASPFSRKVLILAHETCLIDRLEPVLANVGTHVPMNTSAHDALAQLTPLMKVPVLVPAGEAPILDSRVICEYLDALHDKPRFFPAQSVRRWKALSEQALSDGVLDSALLCRFEMARPPGMQSAAWLQGQRRRMIQALDQMDRLDRTAGSVRATPTIGDVSIACALGYLDFRFSELDWRMGRPKLDSWFQAWSDRPSMRSTMPMAVASDLPCRL